MIKTDNFVTTMLSHGMVDDAVISEKGYDIQYKGNIVSVRLDGKGNALIYSKKSDKVVEVSSGRLDNVLHRYIMQSLFGTQSGIGTRDMRCNNTFFIPTKVIKNSVIFEDSEGRKYTVRGSIPKAVLALFDELCDVNADDCIILLDGFDVYDSPEEPSEGAKDDEIEIQVLKCSLDTDEWAVSPRAERINDVGNTIVGSLLCSSADKVTEISFEEDERKLFSSRKCLEHTRTRNIVSSRLVRNAASALRSSAARKAVEEYLDAKYPDGLCVSAVSQVMAYEAPSLFKAAKISSGIDYEGFKKVFSGYLRNCETVSFRLDSNKSMLCSTNIPGKSVAKFRCIPDVSAIKNAIMKEGYLLSELSDGLEFPATHTAVSKIVNCCKDFVPVVEKMNSKPNIVSVLQGRDASAVLSSFGINDERHVFNSVSRIVIN